MLKSFKNNKITYISLFLLSVAIVLIVFKLMDIEQELIPVYVAKIDIDQSTRLNYKNFEDYIFVRKYPKYIVNEMKILKVNDFNKNKIVRSRIVSRYKGDPITHRSLSKRSDFSVKYFLESLSYISEDREALVPIILDISEKERSLFQDIKRGDKIELWFLNQDQLNVRYTNLPVIDVQYDHNIPIKLISTLTIDLAKKFEIESKMHELKIIYLSRNCGEVKELDSLHINKGMIDSEYKKNIFYDLSNIKIEKLQE